MLKRKWTYHNITNDGSLNNMVDLYTSSNIEACAFDTETTGLNHMRDKPFLYQFGWITATEGHTFVVDLEHHPTLARRCITLWHCLVYKAPIYLGHNVRYDMHMEHNIGLPYKGTNISDTQIWIRLASDNVPERKGGAPMGLKKFCARFVDHNARFFEKELAEERTQIAGGYNNLLQDSLNKAGKPPAEWGFKSWTKGCLKKFFDDTVHRPELLPEPLYKAWKEWHDALPEWLRLKVTGYVDSDMIQYDKLTRENVIKYGHMDIVYTLETYLVCEPIVRTRQQEKALELEHSQIYPLLDMERQGFKIDRDYVLNAKEKTYHYILKRREDLERMAGRPLRISQHAAIIEILKQQYNLEIASTNADELDTLVPNLKREGGYEQAIDFIETLQELRTLEKWYSTYICRFVYDLQFGDKIYTTINQVGAASGRVTSDFQQFPNSSMNTIEGEELFCPRAMVITKDEDYLGTVYLDYSQIELRVQAMYTILVGTPDLNLCRAYMPYKCHTFDAEGRERYYDYKDPWCIAHAYDRDWYYDEAPDKHWEPLDVHGATTKAAFDITEDDPRYKSLRSVGKRVNFAKNYGAQRGKIATMFPEYDMETIERIDGAYYKAFPGVKAYHNYCYQIAQVQPCVNNCFGVKYYNVSGHNLINMLIQGTSAYFLKMKIAEVYDYLNKNKCKSKFIMEIHDELQFIWHKDDDPSIFWDIQAIMQEWDGTLIPIVADMELSTTNWNEKFEVESKEDFYVS